MKTRLSDFVPGSRELAHTSSRWTGEDAAYYNYPFLLTNRFIHTYAHTPAQPPCSCVDDPHLDDRGLWQDMLSAMDLCRIPRQNQSEIWQVGNIFVLCLPRRADQSAVVAPTRTYTHTHTQTHTHTHPRARACAQTYGLRHMLW